MWSLVNLVCKVEFELLQGRAYLTHDSFHGRRAPSLTLIRCAIQNQVRDRLFPQPVKPCPHTNQTFTTDCYTGLEFKKCLDVDRTPGILRPRSLRV